MISYLSLSNGNAGAKERLAQAAYYGEREGAGNDLELGPGPEHAVKIITLRSPAECKIAYRILKF